MQRLQPGSDLVPRRTHTDAGTPRRVGVEIELAGLEIETIAEVVAEAVGGTVHRVHDYELTVETTDLGPFRIERDLELLKRLGRERAAATEEPALLGRLAQSAVESLAKTVAPCELVTPPLPFERLPDLDRISDRLRERGAEGTRDGLLHAFGVHFNPEAPSLRPGDILAHLRAFVLLYPWLLERLAVDLKRRVTPFIDPFPGDYALLIADPSYAPSLERLIDDYLALNPTRDRALDMLCLFAHLDEPRVRAAVDDHRVRPRPTYHYRLSNSAIGDPGWHPTDGWRYWLLVEDLAADEPQLTAMCAAFCADLDRPLGGLRSHWDERMGDWLAALGGYGRL